MPPPVVAKLLHTCAWAASAVNNEHSRISPDSRAFNALERGVELAGLNGIARRTGANVVVTKNTVCFRTDFYGNLAKKHNHITKTNPPYIFHNPTLVERIYRHIVVILKNNRLFLRASWLEDSRDSYLSISSVSCSAGGQPFAVD